MILTEHMGVSGEGCLHYGCVNLYTFVRTPNISYFYAFSVGYWLEIALSVFFFNILFTLVKCQDLKHVLCKDMEI